MWCTCLRAQLGTMRALNRGFMIGGVGLLSLSAIPALAEVDVNQVDLSEGLSHGASISIQGAGFGNGDKATPLMWHRIDNESSYNGLDSGAEVPLGSGYVWGTGRPSNPVMIGAERSEQRHSYSEKNYRSPGGNSFFGDPIPAGGAGSSAAREELFVSYWVKFDRDPYERANSASHKFTRVWGGGNDDFRSSWVGWGLTGGGRIAYSKPDANSSIWEAERWHLHELWVSTTEGRMQTYVDGKLRNDWHDMDPEKLVKEHSKGPRLALIGFNPAHGEGYVRKAKYNMDDIMVSGSRARVLLSHAEEWANSTNHEFQYPESWSEGSIDIELNLGGLDDDEPIYVYVVNEDGEVNQEGFPIDCERCPEQVELKVN